MDTTDKTEPPPAGKCCRRCRRHLDAGDFGRDSSQADGLNPTCKACRCGQSLRWRVGNPDKAAWKSARDVCLRQYGRSALTPELIAAKAAELAGERTAKAERRAARGVPSFAAPPGTLTRHSLCKVCGISLTLLHKHRRLNTAGIGDIAIRWPREFQNTLVLFPAEAAAPFIAAMKARKGQFQSSGPAARALPASAAA